MLASVLLRDGQVDNPRSDQPWPHVGYSAGRWARFTVECQNVLQTSDNNMCTANTFEFIEYGMFNRIPLEAHVNSKFSDGRCLNHGLIPG
jgi:hypothetical protein